MKLFRKFISAVLIISLCYLAVPPSTIAGTFDLFAKTEEGITENKPEMLAPPEIEIPRVEKAEPVRVESTEGKSNKWLYYVLGGLGLVGGIAAAAGGGGGGGGSNPTPTPTTGTIVISGPAP